MAKTIYLEASPWNVADGSSAAVRLAGGGLYPYSGARGFTDWRAGVSFIPLFVASKGFANGGWSGDATPQTATINIFPSDDTLRNTLLTAYHWLSAPIEIRSGDDERAPGTYILELTGTVAGITENEGSIALTVADLADKLNVPVVAAQFAGSGGIEGPVEAEGKPKRRSWGVVRNVEGRLLDKPNNIFEFGDPAQPLNSFLSVKDMGRAASPAPTVVTWQGSIAATFAALQASSPAAGSCVVAPSIACVKWWTNPQGPLTADIQGENSGGYVNTIADIASRLAGLGSVSMTSGTVSAINSVRAGVAGLHVGDDNEPIASALDRLLTPCHVLWTLDPAGTVRLAEVSLASSAETVTAIDVARLETFKPVRKVKLGYYRNHRQHNAGEISAAILTADLPDLSAPVGVIVPGYIAAAATANRVRFSRFEKDSKGWFFGSFDGAVPTSFTFNHLPTVDIDHALTTFNFTAANQSLLMLNYGNVLGGDNQFNIPVTPGERIFVSMELYPVGMPPAGRAFVYYAFKDKDGAQISGAAGVVGNILTSNPGAWSRQGAFLTVPAGAAQISLEHHLDNLGGGTATATGVGANMRKPMVVSAAANQTAWPDFSAGPSNESGAEVTRWIAPPSQSLSFPYDYTGTTPQFSTRSMNPKLMTAAGVIPYTAGVTWTLELISGGYNTAAPSSTLYSPSGYAADGSPYWDVVNLQALESLVEYKAAYQGQEYRLRVIYKKAVADPPTSSGGGGGGGGSGPQTVASQGVGQSYSGTGWTDVAVLAGTLGASKTSVNISFNIDAMPQSGTNQNFGNELRVIRTGTSTQIGGTASSPSKWSNVVDPIAASFSGSVSDSGLTAGSAVSYTIQMRQSSGVTRLHDATGSASVVAP